MKRLFQVMCIFIIMGMMLGACTPAAPAAPAQPAASTPKSGGSLKIAYVTSKTNIDVNTETTFPLMEIGAYYYETLFDRGPGGVVKGLLATGETVSADGLTHTIKLQPNVKFHDGAAFDANAVKWNIERKITLKQPLYDNIPFDKVVVVDPLTVQIVLKQPLPILDSILANKTWSMYDPVFSARVGDDALKSQASGTGPFKVDKYVPNEILVLKKNPNYWQKGMPYLDEVTFQIVPDINTRALMLEAGDIDMALGLALQDIDRFKKNSNMTVLESVGGRQWYIILNTTHKPLDDMRVRQALNHAVDKEGIIQAIYLGRYAQAATAPYIWPSIDGYKNAGAYKYDTEKAKSLLAEAGWKDTNNDGIVDKNGEKLTLKFISRKGAEAGDIQVAEQVQDMLKKVGVNAEIVITDSAAFLSTVNKVAAESTHDMINMSVGNIYGDASYIMQTFYSCNAFPPKYYNRAYHCNQEIEKKINESLTATTLEKRNALYAEVIQKVRDEAPIIMLFDTVQTVAMRKYVKGVYHETAITNWPAKYAWLDK